MYEGLPYDEAPIETGLDHASHAQRAGAAMLELVLFGAGLGIGWLIWWVALWNQGVTPAKSVLKLRVRRVTDGSLPSWRRMAAHELLAKGLLPLALVTAAVALVDGDRRSLWDHVTGVAVVRDGGQETAGGGT